MKTMKLLRPTLALLTTLLVVTAQAQSPEPTRDLDKQVDKMDKSKPPTRKVDDDTMEEISRKTGVSEKQLRKQEQETRMGAGSLYIANVLAKESGKSFEEIVALRKGGAGWGRIAKDHNLKLGPLVSEAKKLDRSRESQGKDKDRTGTEAKSEKKRERPDQAGEERQPNKSRKDQQGDELEARNGNPGKGSQGKGKGKK